MALPEQLIDGYRAFLYGRLRDEQDRYRKFAEGQSPQVMVIGCCDSRCAPETIFGAGPGELFVVRNIANLVPPYAPDGEAHGVSSALEFGIVALKVKHIVVLGHAQCGGVKAFADETAPLTPTDFVGKWISLMKPAAEIAGPRGSLSHADYITRLEQANVTLSLKNLLTFPRLREQVERGEIILHGAYFGVATGKLAVRDPKTGEFRQVAAEDHARLFAAPRF